MGSNTLTSFPPFRKRSHDDDPLPSLDDNPPLLKRSCPQIPASAPDPPCSHLSFLEELCEFEGSLESSSPESVSQEELLAEMMKSLEKVIGTIDEPSVSGSQSASFSQSLHVLSGMSAEGQDLTPEVLGMVFSPNSCHGVDTLDVNGCSESQVEIRQFLDASDGELGIPSSPSPRTRADRLVPAESEDWLSVDGRFSDFMTSAQLPPGDVGTYGPSGWLDDGNFYQLEVPICDFSRDHFDPITLEQYL